MKVKLMGIKKVDFVNNKNEYICGTKVFYSFSEAGTTGLCSGGIFIKDENKEILSIDPVQFINKEVDMQFTQKGKISSVSAL